MAQIKTRWADLLKMAEWGVAAPRIEQAIKTYLIETGWLNKTCPTCHVQPGIYCRTLVAPGQDSHERSRPHPARV